MHCVVHCTCGAYTKYAQIFFIAVSPLRKEEKMINSSSSIAPSPALFIPSLYSGGGPSLKNVWFPGGRRACGVVRTNFITTTTTTTTINIPTRHNCNNIPPPPPPPLPLNGCTTIPRRHHLSITMESSTTTGSSQQNQSPHQEQVVIESSNNRYALYLNGVDQPSILEYQVRNVDDNDNDTVVVYDLTHTFVPDQARGKGVAARLVKRAVLHARENGHKIIPSCSYIHTYMKRYPSDQDVLLAKL